MTDAPTGSVQAVNRAMLLLELLAEAGQLRISELASRSGLSLGTVHRLLATLGQRGYVRQDDRRRLSARVDRGRCVATECPRQRLLIRRPVRRRRFA